MLKHFFPVNIFIKACLLENLGSKLPSQSFLLPPISKTEQYIFDQQDNLFSIFPTAMFCLKFFNDELFSSSSNISDSVFLKEMH